MGKFDGILICTDLDGTLYGNDKSISSENREAIEYFKSEGGYFTFITGRMPYYSKDAYEAVSPNVPFGCINGGGVYDGERGEYIFQRALEKEYTELVRFIDENFPEVGIQLCCFDRTCFAKENDVTVRFREITGLHYISCDYRNFDELVGKVLFCTDDGEKMREIARALSAHELAGAFDFVRSERTLYEILPKGTHKGVSLVKIAEHLGLDMSRTVAVGDYDNDVYMLRWAGCGVAVANASRSALDAADVITVSNEESAIARVIYEIECGDTKL